MGSAVQKCVCFCLAAKQAKKMDPDVCLHALQQCNDILRLQEEACSKMYEKVDKGAVQITSF